MLSDGVDLEESTTAASYKFVTEVQGIRLYGKVYLDNELARRYSSYYARGSLEVTKKLAINLCLDSCSRSLRECITCLTSKGYAPVVAVVVGRAVVNGSGVEQVSNVAMTLSPYVDGVNLAAIIADTSRIEDVERVRRSVCRFLSMVSRLEKLGVVHPDLRPENVMAVGGDIERLVIVDFDSASYRELFNYMRPSFLIPHPDDYFDIPYPEDDPGKLQVVGAMLTAIQLAMLGDSSLRDKDALLLCCGGEFIERYGDALRKILGESFMGAWRDMFNGSFKTVTDVLKAMKGEGVCS